MNIVSNSTIPVISLELESKTKINSAFKESKATIISLDEELVDVARYGLRQQNYLAFCPEDSVIENWIAWVFGMIVGIRLFWKLHFKNPSVKELLEVRSVDCCAIKYRFFRITKSNFVVLYDSQFWQMSDIKREIEGFKLGITSIGKHK